MKKKKSKNHEPLTLEGLVSYNREVLFPFMEEHFASKEDLKRFATNEDLANLKNEILTSQDQMMKKLDILLTEKEVRQHQDERQKKLLALIIKALKSHNILSSEDLDRIAKLQIF